MKPKKLVAIIVGSILGIGLIVGGFLFMQNFTRASSETPQNVKISDTTSTSAKISWTTGNDTEGALVRYSTSPTIKSSDQVIPAETPRGKEHSATLTLLTPNTTYYFELVAGENTKFDNGGIPWTFTTKAQNETTSADNVASPAATIAPQTVTPTESTAQPATKSTCTDTDCAVIKSKLGKECSTQEYIKCIKAQQNPSPSN